MTYDFNDAEASSFDLIPEKTIAPMIMTIRPGKSGDGGWLTKSQRSDYEYLNCEFAVTEGPYKGRKFWGNMMAAHPEAENVAVNITRSTLRAILESARGIKSNDESDTAKKARMVEGFGDFSGMEFVGKIGIEAGKDGYDDKNTLIAAVPVNSKDHPKNGGGSTETQKPANEQSSSTPKWAA